MTDSARNPNAGRGTRSKARKRALDLLFEAEARGVNVLTLMQDRLEHPVGEAKIPDYTQQIVRGVVTNWATINETITTYSAGWPMDRMPAVDRNLLRVSTFEILYNDEVPDPVAIDEAVAIAKQLSTDSSPKFVNGLLNRIAEVKSSVS